MARMSQLGRPVYATLGLAVLILVVTYGSMAVWPRVADYRQMRDLDRLWRDRSLPPAARIKAAEMLAEFGPDAAPYLMAAARDPDDLVRLKAYSFLSGIESPGPGRWRRSRWGRSRTSGGRAGAIGGSRSSNRWCRPGMIGRRWSASPCCARWSAPTP
jgi:HEAT repeat protein